MEKEFEKNLKMENMTEPEKKEFIDKVKVEEEAKKHHQPVSTTFSKKDLREFYLILLINYISMRH